MNPVPAIVVPLGRKPVKKARSRRAPSARKTRTAPPSPWTSWVRPHVSRLAAYQPEPAGPAVRLDANESAFDFPVALKREVAERFSKREWNRYPDPECRTLRQALAAQEGVAPEQVLMGNGSDELIRDLLVCFGGPGTRAVVPTPTFSMYAALSRALGGEAAAVPLRPDWSLDLPAVLEALRHPRARLLFLATPNNPTGRSAPLAQIERILEATDRLVVVDEAYRLFAGSDSGSLVPRLKAHPHLVVLGTFSKAWSLAGLRVGYLIARPELVEMVNRVRLPFNLDAFAQTAAEVALEHPDAWQSQARLIVSERERVSRALAGLGGVEVFPSQANFLLVRMPRALRIKARLAERDIAVRGFAGDPALAQCLRITIGRPPENDNLLRQLALALGKG
ncbi:MAG: histidinol-phosphate transaminase [candidate division FCPU426 bacterium]